MKYVFALYLIFTSSQIVAQDNTLVEVSEDEFTGQITIRSKGFSHCLEYGDCKIELTGYSKSSFAYLTWSSEKGYELMIVMSGPDEWLIADKEDNENATLYLLIDGERMQFNEGKILGEVNNNVGRYNATTTTEYGIWSPSIEKLRKLVYANNVRFKIHDIEMNDIHPIVVERFRRVFEKAEELK